MNSKRFLPFLMLTMYVVPSLTYGSYISNLGYADDDSTDTLPSPSTKAVVPAPEETKTEKNNMQDVGFGFSLSGEFLYLTNGGGDLYFAMLGNDIGQVNRKLESFGNTYHSAYRVGLNYQIPYRGWRIGGEWTFYQGEQTNHENDPYDGETAYIVWGNAFTPVAALNFSGGLVSATWNLKFKQVDILIDNPLQLTDYYLLTPNVGGRFLWEKNNFYITNTNAVNAEEVVFDYSNNFHGFGIKGGLDNKFLFGAGFYLSGDIDAALVYGSRTLSDSALTNELNTVEGVNVYGTVFNFKSHAIIPVIDTKLDLGWKYKTDHVALDIFAGYEYHILINGLTTIQFSQSFGIGVPIYENRNIYIHGLNVGARVSF